MINAVAVALLASTSLAGSPAPSAGSRFLPEEDGELPYRPFTSGYGAPETPLPPRPPLPEEEPPEPARTRLELIPQVALSLPWCGDRQSGCEALPAGFELGLTALYRVAPNFAFGITARTDSFRAPGEDSSDLRARMTFFGIAGRLDATENGWWDPYLALALGGGSLKTETLGLAGSTEDRVGFSPALRIAGGIDFVINSWLRFGPTLGILRYAPNESRRCVERQCAWIGVGRSSIAVGTTSLGIQWTLGAGKAL